MAAVAGLVNARAWYGLACLAARVQPRTLASVPARVVFGLPYAPLSALAVFALVIYAARLLFTGTIELPVTHAPPAVSSARSARARSAWPGRPGGAPRGLKGRPPPRSTSAGLSVVGPALSRSRQRLSPALSLEARSWWWAGSARPAATPPTSCAAMLSPMPVRQFSYAGMDARGKGLSQRARRHQRVAARTRGQDRGPGRVAARGVGAAGRARRRERGHAGRVRHAGPPPGPAGLRDRAAQPDRQPGPAGRLGQRRRRGVGGRAERARPPGRQHLALRAWPAPRPCSARSAGRGQVLRRRGGRRVQRTAGPSAG